AGPLSLNPLAAAHGRSGLCSLMDLKRASKRPAVTTSRPIGRQSEKLFGTRPAGSCISLMHGAFLWGSVETIKVYFFAQSQAGIFAPCIIYRDTRYYPDPARWWYHVGPGGTFTGSYSPGG